jgi:hypothetical protein
VHLLMPSPRDPARDQVDELCVQLRQYDKHFTVCWAQANQAWLIISDVDSPLVRLPNLVEVVTWLESQLTSACE